MEQFQTEQVIGKVSPFRITCGEAHSLYKKRNDQGVKKAGSQQTCGWCLSDLPEKFQGVSGSMGAGQICKNKFCVYEKQFSEITLSFPPCFSVSSKSFYSQFSSLFSPTFSSLFLGQVDPNLMSESLYVSPEREKKISSQTICIIK